MGHAQRYFKGKLVVIRHFELEREENILDMLILKCPRDSQGRHYLHASENLIVESR